MTDEEYREYLAALSRKYLDVFAFQRKHMMHGELAYEIDRLSSIARFVRAVSERSDKQILVKEAAQEIANAYVDGVIRAWNDQVFWRRSTKLLRLHSETCVNRRSPPKTLNS